MRQGMIGALAGALVLLGSSGCGIVYTSPSVSDDGLLGFNSTDFHVEIIPMNYETTVAANLMPASAARLPLGFQPGAIERIVANTISPPRLAALPAPPTRPGIRPGRIAERLPPLEAPQPYRIGIADELLLSVNTAGASLEAVPGLISAQAKRQGFVVQDDGAIAIPDAGRIRVAGLTMQDAEAAIFQALVAAGIDPSFSLEIAEFNSQRVAVGGEVGNPSLVPVTLKPLYLHEAVNAAGGITVPDPALARVVLIRDGEVFQISGERFADDPELRNVVLRDGDSVYVETEYLEDRGRARFDELLRLRSAQQDAFQLQVQAEQFRMAREDAAFQRMTEERQIFLDRVELDAVARDYAYVTGEVRTPKRVPLPFENSATLADVLFHDTGGGINSQFGDYSEIYVLRRPTNPEEIGSVLAFHLDADNAVNLTLTSMFEIQNGDIVFVAEQPITAWNRVLTQSLPQLFTSLAATAANF